MTAEYSLLPASTGDRVEREASRGKQQGRTIEIQRLIGRALRARRRLPRARRADAVARLRRAPGRRRHALRGDLRRVRRRAACARPLRALEGVRRLGRRGLRRRRRRCAAARPRLLRGLERRHRHERRHDGRRPADRGAGDGRARSVHARDARRAARARRGRHRARSPSCRRRRWPLHFLSVAVPDAELAARAAAALGRRGSRRRDRPRARAARAAGRAAHAPRRLRRLGALHARLGVRLPRVPRERRQPRPHRPDADRGADRQRHRLPRRGRDHPPGPVRARPHDGRDALARRGDRHGVAAPATTAPRSSRPAARSSRSGRCASSPTGSSRRFRPRDRHACSSRSPPAGAPAPVHRGDRASRRPRRLARGRAGGRPARDRVDVELHGIAAPHVVAARRGHRRRARGAVGRTDGPSSARATRTRRASSSGCCPAGRSSRSTPTDWPDETGDDVLRERARSRRRFGRASRVGGLDDRRGLRHRGRGARRPARPPLGALRAGGRAGDREAARRARGRRATGARATSRSSSRSRPTATSCAAPASLEGRIADAPRGSGGLRLRPGLRPRRRGAAPSPSSATRGRPSTRTARARRGRYARPSSGSAGYAVTRAAPPIHQLSSAPNTITFAIT